ncbi:MULTISPECIES: Ltp family lipoprotein [Corynebacterium]|nr:MULTISPECIES: Ltp family lipoprotein [Corynebacterium]AST20777.1 hypothetical protein CEY17_08335 [Corynebacterium glutamicum ATCC 14067]QJS15909.1 hypothetical protein HK412_06310 [Corynebacterium glutamicum]
MNTAENPSASAEHRLSTAFGEREKDEAVFFGSTWSIHCFGDEAVQDCKNLEKVYGSDGWVDLPPGDVHTLLDDIGAEESEADEVPIEWQNALTKADRYANRQHMSQARLYRQLTSDVGEGFTEEAAQYAIENVNADWNANALVKARNYQERQAMSVDRIYRQLTSEHSEGFTPEQAQYAIDNL